MDINDKYIGSTLDDRYEILGIIGEGGMAVVYKALDRRLNRNVAVKIMREEMASDEEFRRRFCGESQAVAMLSHPNIVSVYDVSHNDDREYIVMELIDGITLKQYMDRRGAMIWPEVVHFSKQIAKAMSHAHERGIIHRDIKPQNAILLRDGTIKVADFGIAALDNEIHENNGQAIGSIHYIAPEQARGECPDSRSDIYSLGVVMYEMLTGRLPYTGDTLAEIAVKHMNADPIMPHELNQDVPPELERITLKAMSRNLETRYQTANELLADLSVFAEKQNKAEDPDGEEYENPDVIPIRSVTELSKEKYRIRHKRSQRVSFLSGTFGVLCVAIALFVFLWNFWMKDVFAPATRISMPKFVGANYDAVLNNAEILSQYHFHVTYVNSPDTAQGTILKQDPAPGRSVMLSPSGIDLDITVSAGVRLVQVPAVINLEYREAKLRLENQGFVVEIENVTSDSVTKDYVVNSSPLAGEELSSGSTVYIQVSSGPQIAFVSVPNLVGTTEDAALSKLESNNLSYGGAEWVTDDQAAGTVIGQSFEPFTVVEEHTKIYLRISSGPAQ